MRLRWKLALHHYSRYVTVLVWIVVSFIWMCLTYILGSTLTANLPHQNTVFVGWIYLYPLTGLFLDRHLEHTWGLWLALLFVIACTLPILVPTVTATGVLTISLYTRLHTSAPGQDEP